ncbi:MAG TPA: hypothetical protein VL424_13270, partial [Pararobbsia sp.]|nr:hypothetical protein [Pararobbsia sp.]
MLIHIRTRLDVQLNQAARSDFDVPHVEQSAGTVQKTIRSGSSIRFRTGRAPRFHAHVIAFHERNHSTVAHRKVSGRLIHAIRASLCLARIGVNEGGMGRG